MFRPEASFPLRFARTVLFPSGPLIIAIVLGSSGMLSDSAAKLLGLVTLAWFFCSLMLVPALLFRPDSSAGPSTEEGGGGGGGPQDPPSRDPGPGGVPLPDAEQSSERVRDHVRRKRRWARRSAREPEPASPKVHR